ncbi:UDP-glucose:glycoprotein glucosyltransferase 2 [Tupaia chinensis]|uniref:UDP-glucose:glycoprotein glucosyltransferase 2 n=1 Tax=Tupaia chinensis TaxID=246437 RepID=UPI000FFB7D98|nr:UDP-glucose:glycoprotein glucosyltransferase 2 [Tupaia chinensis]
MSRTRGPSRRPTQAKATTRPGILAPRGSGTWLSLRPRPLAGTLQAAPLDGAGAGHACADSPAGTDANVLWLFRGSTALWFSLLRSGPSSASKAVTAHLAAKWPETPLLLEASEFMAEESNEKFWQFLETVKELAIYKQSESDYSYYNLILKKAGQFLDNLHINLFKFAFSIRTYSPTIQMFQQIAADEPPPDGCSAFVVIHKEHTCKIKDIKKLLKKALQEYYECSYSTGDFLIQGLPHELLTFRSSNRNNKEFQEEGQSQL